MADPNPTPKPTEAEVRAMKAGPELDALVATSVMGWEWFRVERHFARGREQWRALRNRSSGHYHVFAVAIGDEPVWDGYGETTPKFSTDPAACAELKRRLFEMGWCVCVDWQSPIGHLGNQIIVTLGKRGRHPIVVQDSDHAGTDPVAVECELLAKCAALAALAGKESGT